MMNVRKVLSVNKLVMTHKSKRIELYIAQVQFIYLTNLIFKSS